MSDSVTQRQITAFWDTVASQYEAPERKNVAPPDSRDYADWIEAIRPLLPVTPSDILDVGTGTGFLAGIAARLGHRVTAIDLSTGMLDASALRESGLAITFSVGDAVNPDFPPSSFDAVINRSLIWTLREPVTAFRNWYRVLRPGGRVLAIYGLAPTAPAGDTDAESGPGLFERHYRCRARWPAIAARERDPPAWIRGRCGKRR
jgi:SAM-dependent methyltransferase